MTEFEKALTASGIDCDKERRKRKSLATMFLDLAEREQPLQDRISKLDIPKEAFTFLLRGSIDARNKGIHSDEDIDEGRCEWFTEVIRIACDILRARFVTRENAAALAKRFLNARTAKRPKYPDGQPVFSEVYLYGSLSRTSKQPKDIDLLLVDVLGRIAPMELGYSSDTGEKEKEILKTLDILAGESADKFSTSQNLKAIDSGWLNLTVVDSKFGKDIETTFDTAAVQSDPLFFLNVATDILRFEVSQQRWTKELGSIPIFEELARMRTHLFQLGIGTFDYQRHKERGDQIAVLLADATIAGIDRLRRSELRIASANYRDFLPQYQLKSRATIVQRLIARGLEARISVPKKSREG